MNYKKIYIFAALLLCAFFIYGLKSFAEIKKTDRIIINTKNNLTASIQDKKNENASGALLEPSPEASLVPKLQKTDGVINYISTEQKIVALTFDADMTPKMEYDLKNGKAESGYSENVIKELDKNQTPATLFLAGLWIKNYPEITAELAKNPLFEIANHSYSHSAFTLSCYKLSSIADNLDEEEITQAEDQLKLYAPNYKKYFRFPGLCYDDFDAREAQRLGYKIIGGNISGLDGFNNNAKSIVDRIISRLTPGGIIILHMHGAPYAPRTAEALPEIIRQVNEKGYRFVKISDLINTK